MEVRYLILALLNATLGFLAWYIISTSLRLPKSFQIQFDINKSYFARILRRRFLGFLLYGVLPCVLIFGFGVLGENVTSLADLNISFGWNAQVGKWLLLLMPLTLLFNYLSTRRRATLIEYPEIRVTIWTPWLLAKSAFFWLLYLVGMEFLYRGLVLQSLFMNLDNIWWTMVISGAMYTMVHYFKFNRIALLSFPFGLIMAYVTLKCGSLLPTVLVHLIGGLITEWAAIRQHPEIKVQQNLYTTP
ncbi:MAG: CPBP family intramembrane glutamic endopeptidase [Bacteroidota bacterium]